jgi:hypothetical protein
LAPGTALALTQAMQVRIVANSRSFFRPLAAIVIVCVALMALFQVDLSSRDEWRRTAHGWERSGAWLVAASDPVASLEKPLIHLPAKTRFDTHPIALAFGQLVGTLLALFAVAPKTERTQHGGLRSVISRSFRASVFGS